MTMPHCTVDNDASLSADRGDTHALEIRQLELKEMTRPSRTIVRQLFWFVGADPSRGNVSLWKENDLDPTREDRKSVV